MKRFIDASVAALAMVVLMPVFLVVAALVRFKLGKPILFWQRRPGRHGVPFWIVKFRTLIEPGSAFEQDDSDERRITGFGQLLRSSSLDELPELWNVLKGEMSLVGPRPLLMEYLPLYSDAQRRRHEVRPGITGWAQVNGRNALSWEKRFELDVWYVDNQSLLLDIRILMMTAVKVITRAGITEPGEATMSRFRGSEASCQRR